VSIEYTVTDGTAVIHVTGDLTLANAGQINELGQLALTNAVMALRVDLAHLGLIDSAGLSALHALRERADQNGYTLFLDDPPEHVLLRLGINPANVTFITKNDDG
jgi:anti-anti-sigma factor